LIEWYDGTKVKLEIATDVSEISRLKASIRKRLKYENLLCRISLQAINCEDPEEFLNSCITDMGETVGVSRTYIFNHDVHTSTLNNTHEWCGTDVTPQIDNLQDIPCEDFAWWTKQMQDQGKICYSDIKEIPEPAVFELLKAQNIISILVVPLFVKDQYYGFLGFDECDKIREWPEEDVELLLAMARILSGVIQKQELLKEHKKLEEQLLQAQKMESIGRLAGGVAHDFNNILQVIIGNYELFKQNCSNTSKHLKEQYPELEEIGEASKKASQLTQQLLTFARQQIVKPKLLDINKTTRKTFKMLERLIGENIKITWKPGKNTWPIMLDPVQFDQILTNLCINSRDAIKGTGKITLVTENHSFDEEYCNDHPGFIPGNYVGILVSDNGCGMSKEVAQKAFEPFFTTKKLGKGSGLGLSTVYGIVKQNKGFISVYSESGCGTSIKNFIPRAFSDVIIPDKILAEKRKTKSGTETILLVEDDVLILNITAKNLKKMGYNIFATSIPAEAINIAQVPENKIDLLLTDVIMPEMNGLELFKKIRKISLDIQCLFMSGYTADVIAHQGIINEDTNFISKPFSNKEISESIRNLLKRKKQ
jgi:signal transduction histidine kinase/ActR/RegA family two-component response regulator